MAQAARLPLEYAPEEAGPFPRIVDDYPALRFMGSKQRLLPWIHEVVAPLDFTTVLDAFSGSGCAGYLLKAMGKEVTSNDSLNFAATVATALVENSQRTLSPEDVETLLTYDPHHKHFIENTFSGIFYTPEDLRFLDRASRSSLRTALRRQLRHEAVPLPGRSVLLLAGGRSWRARW